MTARIALLARERVPSRALARAALLSLLLCAALSQLLHSGGAASTAPPVAANGLAGLSELAPAARASISAALGAEEPAYHFNLAPGGFQAANPAQHLGVGIGRSGVLLRSRGLQLGLSLHALGYGGSLQAVSAVRPSGVANRVTYAHAGVSEWYVNGPVGLEQGFTLARAPAAHASGPLTLAISLSGDARAAVARGGRSVTFKDAFGASLRYGDLSASDASGRALRSWIALDGNQLLLRIDAHGARFPLRVDPVVEEEEQEWKITQEEDEAEEGGRSGFSVAISGDANTLLVGAPDGPDGGAAWVFARSGALWTQQGPKLSEGAVSAEGDRFGESVALSEDGDTALIGAPGDEQAQGAAWVFTRSGSTWAPAGTQLSASEGSGPGHLGQSVALSADGETALVGAPDAAPDTRGGLAWVFTRSGSSWSSSEPLAGAQEHGDARFGMSVALSADGATALIGGPLDDESRGAAWVFQRSGSSWTEQGSKLTGGGETSEGRFGGAVALSGNGQTALIGARNDNEDKGAAWVFARSGSSWSEQGPPLTGDGQGKEKFGRSVALSEEGNVALVGAPFDTDPHGVAWLYERSGASWSGTKLKPETFATGGARFGSAVALSANGETALVGAPGDANRSGDADAGAVWVFGPGASAEQVSPAPSVEHLSPSHGPAEGGTLVRITGANFEEASGVRFGSKAAGFKVISPSTIEARTPPGLGLVDVSVTGPGGTSAKIANDRFRYELGVESENEEEEVVRKGEEETPRGAGGNGNPSSGAGSTVAAEAVLAIGPTAGGACGASLLSRNVAVQPHSRALFRLRGTGAGSCAGKLRLNVELKLAGRRFKLKTIGTAVFAIASGQQLSISVKLNAAGRALLRAGHGRLNASLLLVKSSPAPLLAQTASVRLTRQRAKPKTKTT